MKTIVIKGIQKPIVVQDKAAEQIEKIFDDNTIPDTNRINIGGNRFVKGDIKGIFDYVDREYKEQEAELIKEKERIENGEYISRMNKDFSDRVQKFKRLPLEKRAEDISLASFICKTLGIEIEKTDIINAQKKFLQDNPQNTYPNPVCIREIVIVPMRNQAHMEAFVVKSMFSLVERVYSAHENTARKM